MHASLPLISTIATALVMALIMGFIAIKLKLPTIVGYLLAGIIIGPFTPGFVANAELAKELAEIGIMLLMFGVGLHFSLDKLLETQKIALPGALLQITVATMMGSCLATMWGWSCGASLVFGLALSVASTVVLIRALESLGLIGSMNGQIVIGWLIVEDLAMVLALVFLPLLAEWFGASPVDHGSGSFWLILGLTLLKIGAFIIVMLFFGRWMVPKLLWHVARTGSHELFTLTIIAAAVGFAFGASRLFGISFALGAFFAGMIIRESKFSMRAAEESLPFRDAFAVLFFVSIGMLFNPYIFVTQPWQVLAVVGIIVIGKSIAAALLVLAFRYPLNTALIVSVSLAQIGEFSFILAGLGVHLKLLPKEGLELIIAGSLLSIALNPFLFKGIKPLEKWLGIETDGDPLMQLPAPAEREFDEEIPFKSVLDQTDDIVIITDVEPLDDPLGPRIIYVNQAFTTLSGYTREEAIGKTPRILQGDKTDKETLKRIRMALEKREAISVELLNYAKDQTEYWLDFTIVPIKDSTGNIRYFAAIEHDITERKKMEEAQATLSALVEFSAEAIIGKNVEGTILSWNKAAEKLYAYTAQEAIGTNIRMLFPEDRQQEFQDINRRIVKGEVLKHFETLRVHKDGHVIPVSLTIAPIKDTQGVVVGATTTAHDITQQKLIEEKLKHIAEHDALTGLINRPLFEDRLIQAIANAKREKCGMAVCFLDIDDFKNINDTYGHHIGDLLLCATAKAMQKCMREIDTLARLSGDEFALILSHLNGEEDVIKIMKKLFRLFSKGFLIDEHDIKVTLSIGIALYPQDGMDDFLKKADSAMYYVKKHGKNNFIFYR